ncbi:MAG: phosphatidylglycerophosphatase A [Holosporales bacterium]|jgi:phosphatidylglycerophosphatase A|nr:phosphatidylglycerophosphatase A [Holosporales bacterium]
MYRRDRQSNIAEIIATCGGVGYLPKCPGTYGSLLALALWSIGKACFSVFFWMIFLCTAIPLGGMAILKILRCTPEKDPSYIVVDEFLGQLLALTCIPQTTSAGLLAFLLFRLLDIKKIGAIRSLDTLSQQTTSAKTAAICVLGDDLLAGLCAGILVRIGWWITSL